MRKILEIKIVESDCHLIASPTKIPSTLTGLALLFAGKSQTTATIYIFLNPGLRLLDFCLE